MVLEQDMFIILWKYQVQREKQSEFDQIYASDGVWAELFRKAEGYLGTELLQDETDPACFLTIDRWASKENFEVFQSLFSKQYQELDAKCEGLTENEILLGRWQSL